MIKAPPFFADVALFVAFWADRESNILRFSNTARSNIHKNIFA